MLPVPALVPLDVAGLALALPTVAARSVPVELGERLDLAACATALGWNLFGRADLPQSWGSA